MDGPNEKTQLEEDTDSLYSIEDEESEETTENTEQDESVPE